ncbi:hypothetical protein MKEN_01338200 [Mycena kentingensis (nom. inval.)]|nr:hypothetical protein MKEN_01338200 [Mycena kentingensis (nom. inval.)]
MFSKSLITVAALLAGSAHALVGTAFPGFTGSTLCGCPPFNGPFAVTVPAAQVGTHQCCNEGFFITYHGKNLSVVFSGVYNDAVGSADVQLSQAAFDFLKDGDETELSPVTWAFST